VEARVKNSNYLKTQKNLIILILGSCLISYHVYQVNRSIATNVETESPSQNLIATKAIDNIVNEKIDNLESNVEYDTRTSEQKSEIFQKKMNDMRICLELEKTNNESLNPNFDNLYRFVMNDFGNSFHQTSEWSNTHLKLENGEERRIRIEVEATSEQNATKKLSYFGLDEDKLPIRIPVDRELETASTEDVLKKLESEGKITFKENASRAYFASGNQIYFTEKNGTLADLEVQNKSGRIFKCNDVTQSENLCRCL